VPDHSLGLNPLGPELWPSHGRDDQNSEQRR